MKKKTKIFTIGSIILLIILLFPIHLQLKDNSRADISYDNAIDTSNFPVSMSADEMKEQAIERGFVVFDGFELISGGEVWQEFYERTRSGEPAVVYLAKYYTLDKERVSEELYEKEKDEYPKLFLLSLIYDGENYTITSRPGYEEEPESIETYPYLVKFSGEPSSAHAVFDTYVYYVLVHDPKVTWKELEHGMFSSQFGDYIDHHLVYGEHIKKAEQ